MEKVRAMLIASGQPRFLWGEAVMHAVWLKNRTGTRALEGRTPYEVALGEVPDISGVPEWGCIVWVHYTKDAKVGERARPGRWVGFDSESQGHRIYWPEAQSVSVERNVRFVAPTPVLLLDDEPLELEGEPEELDHLVDSSAHDPPSTPPPSTSPSRPGSPSTPPPAPAPMRFAVLGALNGSEYEGASSC